MIVESLETCLIRSDLYSSMCHFHLQFVSAEKSCYVVFIFRELSSLIKELGEAFISKGLKLILVIPPPLYSRYEIFPFLPYLDISLLLIFILFNILL